MNKSQIQLPALFSDGMVLQRNATNKVWGKATPGEEITLVICEHTYKLKVSLEGRWEFAINDLPVGGPYELTINSGNESIVIKDVLVGDVWVLGGQSNMELPVSRTLDLFEDEISTANNPMIRRFMVPQVYNFHKPQEDITGGSWAFVNPQDVLSFSAVGYFFATKLYEKYQIPIGLIQAAVGGTPAQAWLKEETLMQYDRFHELLAKCKDDEYVTQTQLMEEQRNNLWYQTLFEKDLGLQKVDALWYSEMYDDSAWKSMELPGNFFGTELEEIKGSVWFRKEIMIPKEMLHSDAKLFLGTLIDGDDTYINGVKVGNTGYLYPPRRYQVPKEILREGKNLIAVRLIMTQNVGAFVKDMPYYLRTNGTKVNISGEWKYQIGARMEALQPTTFFQYMPTGVYNGMIYPLHKFAMKGVLWYQGESNTDAPGDYNALFESVIKDWRDLWGNGELPFLFVQLANLNEASNLEPESNWARLRNEQRKTLKVANTGMAVIIDVGEYNDLHPQNKKAVGERLSLLARNIAYGESIVSSGPLYQSMEVNGDKVILHFSEIGSGLIVKGEGELSQFTICGNDGKYVIAHAMIKDNQVVVWNDDVKEPMGVRYAWADNPEGANLYNKEGLPASPFEAVYLK